MSKVLTFSRTFPAYHPKKGQPTHFVEKIWKFLHDNTEFPYGSGDIIDAYDKAFPIVFNLEENIHNHKPKGHTVRSGHRWKVGDKFSPRVWSGKPYQSKQIIIAPDIEVKKVWDFEMKPSNFIDECRFFINGNEIVFHGLFDRVAQNDGLNRLEFAHWFCGPDLMSNKRKPFSGQIICWDDSIEY